MKNFRHLVASCLLILAFSGIASAEDIALKQDRPDVYQVVKGDTLWDIAGKFLQKPWQWPMLWHANSQIKNPHLIFPGDKLALKMINGQPYLQMIKGGTVKLKPSIRSSVLEQALPVIPLDAVHQFLSRPFVMPDDKLERAPEIFDFKGEHIMGSTGKTAYVRYLTENYGNNYEILRPGKAYEDGETGEILGYEALYIGTAKLLEYGATSKVLITDSVEQIAKGDKLYPAIDTQGLTEFYPKSPDQAVSGKIISVMNGVSQIAQYQTVILDRGTNVGLVPGDVLTIWQEGPEVKSKRKFTGMSFAQTYDQVFKEGVYESHQLPDEIAGTMMVFRVFDKMSFALVMSATSALHVGDVFTDPR